MKKNQIPYSVKINLAKYKALELLIEGYEIIPVNQDGAICSQYLEEKRSNPSEYKINNKAQIDHYFHDGFYDVAFIKDLEICHFVPTVKKSEYFFYDLKERRINK